MGYLRMINLVVDYLGLRLVHLSIVVNELLFISWIVGPSDLWT